MATPSSTSASSFSFNLSLSLNNLNTSKTKFFGPRLGTILLRRSGTGNFNASNETQIAIPTPTFITSTSRGIIPHLSRDNIRRTPAVRWINVPFETFMEHNPPIPTLHSPSSKHPLHDLLGFDPAKQIVSLSARDPDDDREMPPNGNAVVSVWTLRGVRKLTPSDWQTYSLKCQPDIVFALSDTPFTDPINHAYSQKRLTKSIERTAAWLGVMLRLFPAENENEKAKKWNNTKPETDAISTSPISQNFSSVTSSNPILRPQTSFQNTPLPPIFLPMAGGSSLGARRAFASSLLEPFYGPEADAMKHRGIKTLDEGVVGYSFDLAPLRGLAVPRREAVNRTFSKEVCPEETSAPNSAFQSFLTPSSTFQSLIPLIQTSLTPLTPSKPRLINSTDGPHEILRYITQVGVDVFDAAWAQRLAGWGVGLDFEFPVRGNRRQEGRSLGHNLYDDSYALDFGTIADCYRGAVPAPVSNSEENKRPICTCAACSPLEQEQLRHGVDSPEYTLIPDQIAPTMHNHHTRAYIHHLLQTHEMGAHALLSMHNLTVLDRFFEGVRGVLSSTTAPSQDDDEETKIKGWIAEVDLFCQTYDEAKSEEMIERAKRDWKIVDHARGKGRLARERGKETSEIPK